MYVVQAGAWDTIYITYNIFVIVTTESFPATAGGIMTQWSISGWEVTAVIVSG